MKAALILAVVVSVSQTVTAFPWAAGNKTSTRSEKSLEDRGLLDGILGLVDGLLGSIASNVDPKDRRPDAAHPFIMPGPTDQRGPCPGLNTLANHGYLPRNGIVTLGQILDATAEGFNMATDLSTLLGVLAVAFTGNIDTLSFSIGGEDDRTYSQFGVGSKAAGRQFGLDAHSRIEGDASATKQDFYLNNGDVHNGDGSRFARFAKLAKAQGGQFNVPAANALYAQNVDISLARNPKFYATAYTLIVILGEYPFLPNFFSNGTYGFGGTSNYESMSSFLGFQLNKKTGEFCYVPERFPDNWYRRATPYGVANGLVLNLVPTYLNQPLSINPLGALLSNPAQFSELGCAIYQLVMSEVAPSLVGSTVDRIQAVTTFLQETLIPTIDPIFGCTVDSKAGGSSMPETQDDLQETREGGGKEYGICAA